MKKFLFSVTALIMITSLVACTKLAPKTSVETSDTNNTVASETASKTLVFVTNKKEPYSTKNESHTTEKINTANAKPASTKLETIKVISPLPSYTPEDEMIELFNSINYYREANGLYKLSLDPELCKLAYIRAQEQELMEGHTRPNRSRFFTILGEYDYSYITCGENIALIWGSPSTRPFELWKNSETHNENILKTKWTKTGIAMYQNPDGRYNIVQLFAH